MAAWSVSPLKKVKREAAAQRRPARSEPEKPRFSAKRQAAGFETPGVSNEECSIRENIFGNDSQGQSARARGTDRRAERGRRAAAALRGEIGLRAGLRKAKKKRLRHDATTLVFQNWCRGRDSNPHSNCHYPLKIACLPVPPPRRQKALYAKPRRLASLFCKKDGGKILSGPATAP